MLPVTLDSFRLFLHVTAAAVWVGGQLTMLGLLPALRTLGPDAPRAGARAFGRVAWGAFAVLVVTGIWSLVAVDPSSRDTAWHATLGIKLLAVAASGIAAAVHSVSRTRVALAAGGAIGLLAGLLAVWLGILLTTGS